jgi:hypothetical protein
MHGPRPDAEGLRRFEASSPGRQLLTDAVNDIATHRATPEPLALAPCPREASLDPLDNHRARTRQRQPSSETSPFRLACGADRLSSLFRRISIPVALFESSYGANRDRIVISFRGVAPQLQFHPSQLTDPAWVLG